MLDGYLAQDPDTQLPVGEWDRVEAWLKRTRTSYFDFTFRGEAKDISRRFAGHEREVSLLSLYDAKAIGLHEFVSDYYVDPHRRSLIPAAVLAQFEPWWRQLYDNRPHRVGGEFDALQSTPRIGPTGSLTLLHLASDNAMNWAWGDSGIVYFELTTKKTSLKDGLIRLLRFWNVTDEALTLHGSRLWLVHSRELREADAGFERQLCRAGTSPHPRPLYGATPWSGIQTPSGAGPVW
ncbi:DUF1963 domain-containing protein [Roseibium salinum]|nr:DUF1963 domain-containing protein [Roseibium salinum]